KEVQSAELIRALRPRRKLGDAERRRVGCEDRVRSHDRLDRRVRAGLLVDVLDDCFDHEVAASEGTEISSAAQIGECRVALLSRDLSLRDAILEKLPDASESLVEQRLIRFADDRRVARCGRYLRDPRAHQSAPEDTDTLDLHIVRLHSKRSAHTLSMMAAMP